MLDIVLMKEQNVMGFNRHFSYKGFSCLWGEGIRSVASISLGTSRTASRVRKNGAWGEAVELCTISNRAAHTTHPMVILTRLLLPEILTRL